MASATFSIVGDVTVEVTVTEQDDGSLLFDLQVVEGGTIGDLNAIYFDISDNDLVSGLSVEGGDVTGEAFKVDGVTKIDNFTNMNGEVVKDLGKFDGGVQFGTQGIGTDDIRSTSFVLSHKTEPLTLENFSLMDFGVRLTSVGEEGGERDGSLKIGDTAPVLEGEDPGPDPVCDDFIIVSELETSAPPFPGAPTDVLESGETSLLANNPDATSIIGVTGGEVGQIVEGSNGGFIVINADGTFDFSNADPSNDQVSIDLAEGDSLVTEFTYLMDNGLEATLCVQVNGFGDAGDGGGTGA